jgi:hypothetical protein|tara:strand:- start:37 stop:627 length:591 start_codon:yes stop_codon:yes gene_type:complete
MFDLLLKFASISVYGIAILLVPIFGLAWLLKKFVPRAPSPFAVTAVFFVIGIFVLPPLPKYLFSIETEARLTERTEYKLISKSSYRSLSEPATWIFPVTNAFLLLRPVGFLQGGYDKTRNTNSFEQIFIQYDKDPVGVMIDADCEDQTYQISAPDEEGILRVLPEWIQMDAVSYEMYCETDYTVQFEEVIKKRIPN